MSSEEWSSLNHVDMEGKVPVVRQNSTILDKPYLVKWSKKGLGVKTLQKSVHVVYGSPIVHTYIG